MDNQMVEQIIAYTVDEVSIKNAYEFRVPPNSIVGDGVSAKIGQALADLNVRNVFIITDQQIVRLGLMGPMLRSLKRCDIQSMIFDEVMPEPTDQVVLGGIECLKTCGCDAIIAFGGGSVIDAGKAIAVFSANPFDPSRPLTSHMPLAPRLPLVAVPTTAGTGSEVTSVSVITHQATHVKIPHQHPSLIPDVAVIDPTLTLGIPPLITAATGLDVLTHAIESYLARGVCNLGQALSFSSIQLVSNHLRRAVGDGSNLEARHKMAIASYMAGMSFSNAGLGVCHAIAHQIGAKYHVAHGTSNALILPEVMRFNMLVREERLGQIARAFNQKIDSLDPKDAALKGIEAVRELIADVGLPTQLRQVHAHEEDFEELALQALEDPTLTTNPRTVRKQDVIDILQRSY